MLNPEFFIDKLRSHGIDFFAGVPDSLLKSLCAWMKENLDPHSYIIAANEGAAAALAAGHYLATGKPGCIYMQNSGIGNAVNPLLSLLDADVYRIPALLVIGWRGMPGVHDEPQHLKQGRVTTTLCDAMEIPYLILSTDPHEASQQIETAVNNIKQTGRQFALIVPKNTFEPFKAQKTAPLPFPSREDAIKEIVKTLPHESAIISTTGMISRELFELRVALGMTHETDFLTVGSMGHASQIALGIALAKPDRRIVCLDGDGAFLMHLGSSAITGALKPKNFIHFVINNGAHDSVGGQDTVAFSIDIPAIARACGYTSALRVETLEDIAPAIEKSLSLPGPTLLEIRVRKGARADLGRPTTSPEHNKNAFMKFLQN